jgi:hemolysin activation/secretion protein
MFGFYKIAYPLLLLSVCFFGLDARAQTLPTGLSQGELDQTNPSRIEKQFEAPQRPKSTDKEIVPDAKPDDLDPNVGANSFFELRGIEIIGASVYSQAELSPLYDELIDTRVSLAQMFALAQMITVKYRDDGYILSQAFLPPQTVNNGIIQIRVVEGFIDKIDFEGSTRGELEYLKSLASPVLEGPLQAKRLERFVLLVNDLPGLKGEVVIKPSTTTPGAADITMLIKQNYVRTNLSLDNRGSRFVGPIQISADFATNAIIYNFDQLTFGHVRSAQGKELNLYTASYQQPIWSDGAILSLDYTRSFVEPGYTLDPFDVESESTSYSVTAKYPIIRSRSENLYISAGFDVRNAKTLVLDSLQSEDRVRSAELSLSYDFVDSGGAINLISGTVRQGLDILNARESGAPNTSRTAGRNDYTKISLQALRLEALSRDFSLYTAANAQISFSQLLSSEEFGYGGAQFGRAYDPSEITGEHGLAAMIEIRYDPYIPSWPVADMMEFYAFYDFGAAWKIESEGDINGSRLSGTSTGGGFRTSLWEGFSASFEMALPISKQVDARVQNDNEKGNDWRGFFSVSQKF